MSKLSVVETTEIWNDDHGYRYEVGEDSDGLGMTEIRYFDPTEKEPAARITVENAAVPLLVEALKKRIK